MARRAFVICVRNDEYPAMLQAGKIYEQFSDPGGEAHELIRVVDEDNDSALYPAEYFLPIELNRATVHALDSYGVLQPQP